MDSVPVLQPDDAAEAPPWAEWRERVATPADLAACLDACGILPLRAGGSWPSLAAVLAPTITTKVAWAWVGDLVTARRLFVGYALPGLNTVCLTAMGLFPLVFARTPGSDPLAAYAAGHFSLTTKAVVELLQVRGPLTVQQIRLGLGQHKRFLIHDTPTVLRELERALVIIGGSPALADSWRKPATGRGPARPRSRFNPPPSPDIDLRVWELVFRWAPPAALAAADRWRERPAEARAALRAHLAALNPLAPADELDTLLGDTP
jgi:hypothetical protein